MVTGENLSSGLAKTGSAPHGFHATLSAVAAMALPHNQFFRLDVETPPRHRHGIGVMHRRRARLEDERPQLGEVLTPVVKIVQCVPAKHRLAEPIPPPGQSPPNAGSEPGTLPAPIIATSRRAN